jgi:hypothetical protein
MLLPFHLRIGASAGKKTDTEYFFLIGYKFNENLKRLMKK